MRRRAVCTAYGKIAQCRKAAKGGLLLEKDDLRSRHNRAPTLVGFDLVREQFEERGLPRAVAPDQRKPVALADENVEILEQPTRSLDEAEAFIGEDGRGHVRFLIG